MPNLLLLVAARPWILMPTKVIYEGFLPFQKVRKTLGAKAECGRYWRELLEQKTSKLRSAVTEMDSMDSMGVLNIALLKLD
ncbi:hypothetical protein LTR66_008413 [Elasticomyces elasticus]|nr:hypothetical protein LTR66_008413 [Elasticomyces elasticus]